MVVITAIYKSTDISDLNFLNDLEIYFNNKKVASCGFKQF